MLVCPNVQECIVAIWVTLDERQASSKRSKRGFHILVIVDACALMSVGSTTTLGWTQTIMESPS